MISRSNGPRNKQRSDNVKNMPVMVDVVCLIDVPFFFVVISGVVTHWVLARGRPSVITLK